MQCSIWQNLAWAYFRCWCELLLWKGKEGGVSYISERYSNNNNMYLIFMTQTRIKTYYNVRHR